MPTTEISVHNVTVEVPVPLQKYFDNLDQIANNLSLTSFPFFQK